MNKVTITVDIDGNAVSREFVNGWGFEYDKDYWGGKVVDMLDTIKNTATIPF